MLRTGTKLAIEATVLHAVDLGGDTNYCLSLPSGHTAWVLGSALGDQPSPEADEPEAAEPEAAETKHRPSPPTRRARKAT